MRPASYTKAAFLVGLCVWVMMLSSCVESATHTSFQSHKAVVINIQPFEDFSERESAVVLDSLKKYFDNLMISAPVQLPDKAYVKARNRYRADTLIAYLRDTREADTISVGLTHKDISTTKEDVQDWGVMGLGYRPGRACVISTFRLKKSNKNEQLIKVVLHEIGHTLGLDHCADKSCLMRDAEGGNPLDEEKDFCKKCKKHLSNKGMKIKQPL